MENFKFSFVECHPCRTSTERGILSFCTGGKNIITLGTTRNVPLRLEFLGPKALLITRFCCRATSKRPCRRFTSCGVAKKHFANFSESLGPTAAPHGTIKSQVNPFYRTRLERALAANTFSSLCTQNL